MQHEASQDPSWAVGFRFFTVAMLALLGSFQTIAGIAGVFDNEFFVLDQDYVLRLDATSWGWIHLIAGGISLVTALGMLMGVSWTRPVTIVIAMCGAITNFAFLPIYPVWAVLMIAICLGIVWTLTVHGPEVDEAIDF